MIQLEKNILRILKIYPRAQVPECSEWNSIGITHEEAEVISYRNKLALKILESSFLPSLRIFEFSKGSLNETMQKGGDETGKTQD